MNEIAKSIRVGTINFFGIVVPGLLMIFIIYIGCVMPIVSTVALYADGDPGKQTIVVTKEYEHVGTSDIVAKEVETKTTDALGIFENQIGLKRLSTGYQFLDLVVLLIASYVLGYILRLSSPDELDRISAVKVLDEEKKYQKWKSISDFRKAASEFCKVALEAAKQKIPEERELYEKLQPGWRKWKGWSFVKHSKFHEQSEEFAEGQTDKFKDDDEWPFDPYNYFDKYPYLGFHEYLTKRGHKLLAKQHANWGDNFIQTNIQEVVSEISEWLYNPSDGAEKDKKQAINHVKELLEGEQEKLRQMNEKKGESFTRRSKTHINKMKMNIRVYCPELMDTLESKEAHIRLMAGTWAAFKFSLLCVGVTFGLLVALLVSLLIKLLEPPNIIEPLLFFFFICLILLCGMGLSIGRIEKLFHYRRVSELFHIVLAADLAEEVKERKKNSSNESHPEHFELKLIERKS